MVASTITGEKTNEEASRISEVEAKGTTITPAKEGTLPAREGVSETLETPPKEGTHSPSKEKEAPMVKPTKEKEVHPKSLQQREQPQSAGHERKKTQLTLGQIKIRTLGFSVFGLST